MTTVFWKKKCRVQLFSGWSSRIEIHEQFAEVQDERLEELTDSLVSCMTGPEGQGGDDQVKLKKKLN